MFFKDNMKQALDVLASNGFAINLNQPVWVSDSESLDQCLHSILTDTTALASLLNRLTLSQKVDLALLEEVVVSIFSRLLQFHHLESTQQLSELNAVYHTGMLLFMITLAFQCESRQVLSMKSMYSKTRQILQRDLRHLDTSLVLWVLLLGHVLISEVSDSAWLEEKIQTLLRELETDSWTAVLTLTINLPWVAAVHDYPARILVEKLGCKTTP